MLYEHRVLVQKRRGFDIEALLIACDSTSRALRHQHVLVNANSPTR